MFRWRPKKEASAKAVFVKKKRFTENIVARSGVAKERSVAVAENQPVENQQSVDHLPAGNVSLRLEARCLAAKEALFSKGAGFTRSVFFITSSIAVSF